MKLSFRKIYIFNVVYVTRNKIHTILIFKLSQFE